MPLFHYRALNPKGQYQEGDWFGASKRHLYHLLKRQNLKLLACKTIKKEGWKAFLSGRISPDDLIEFCLHLAQMDAVKITLSEAILLFAQNHTKRAFKSILYTISDMLQQGFLLSQACRLYPTAFDPIVVESITLAEKTGKFGETFQQLESYLIHKKHQQQKLKQSLRYPLILLVVMLLLMGIMVGVFVPHLQTHLNDINPGIPSIALKTLISSVTFLEFYGSYIMACVVLGIAGYYGLYQFFSFFRVFNDWLVLKIPFIGNFKKSLLMNNFMHTLSLLLNAHIHLLPSLEKAIVTVPNHYIQRQLTRVYEDIQTGSQLSQALKSYDLVSPLLFRLIQLGEETGNLAVLVQQAAACDLEKTWKKIRSLLAWIEPILIIMMGCIMVWVVTATVIPLYSSLAEFER